MKTIREMAEEYANSADGSKHRTFEEDLSAAYLAGVKAALEMAAKLFPPTMQRFSGFDSQQRIRALIPES